jgi:hypothetical protein
MEEGGTMLIAQRALNAASSIRKSLATSWEWLLFFASAVFLAYAAGIATDHFRLPPYSMLAGIWAAGEDWSENWRMRLGIEPTEHLRPAKHEGDGVIQYDENRSSPGVTLIESVFDDNVGLRLFDSRGNILHTWPALSSEIAPNTDFKRPEDIPTNDWETLVHGAALYPDGDVLFNLPDHTMVRMNACGEVEWKLPAGAHHSIDINDDGNI